MSSRVVGLPSQKWYVTVVKSYDTLSEVVCHRGKVVGLPSQKWYVTVVKS